MKLKSYAFSGTLPNSRELEIQLCTTMISKAKKKKKVLQMLKHNVHYEALQLEELQRQQARIHKSFLSWIRRVRSEVTTAQALKMLEHHRLFYSTKKLHNNEVHSGWKSPKMFHLNIDFWRENSNSFSADFSFFSMTFLGCFQLCFSADFNYFQLLFQLI